MNKKVDNYFQNGLYTATVFNNKDSLDSIFI